MRFFLSITLLMLAGVPGVLPCAAELSWHQEKGFQWAELPVPREGKAGFTLLTPEQTGITFTNFFDERIFAANRVLFNGSGLAIGDIYHNGLPAIFFCSLDGHNALYRNLGGMKFKERDGGVRDNMQQPDLPRGGVCGHQRGWVAGFAGEHDGERGAVFYEQRGRDFCRVQRICRHVEQIWRDNHGSGGH